MFFLLSKLLHFLLMPLVWAIGLLIFAWITKSAVIRKRLMIGSVCILLFFSNSFILDEFLRAWEVPGRSYDPKGSYDAGIVLGGFISFDPSLDRLQFERSSDRLFQAVELYKRGIIGKIVFTGGSGMVLKPDEKEAVFVKRYLHELGIPVEDLLLESESRNTRENAQLSKVLLEKEYGDISKKKFLLITSGLHMKRSLKCFEKENIKAIPYSTDRYAGPRKFIPDHLLLPNAYALHVWTWYFHELVGYAVYSIAGYI